MTTPPTIDELPGPPSPAALTRRAWLGASVPVPTPTPLTVFKDPECGCCQQWVMHMAAAGFRPAVQDVQNMAAIKDRYGVPAALRSCHTALVGNLVGNYVIEGHVPPADVRHLLRGAPPVHGRPVRGLAVPGMPTGSPGMEGTRSEPYDVLAFSADGSAQRFASH